MKRNRVMLSVALVLFFVAEACLGHGAEGDSDVAAFAAMVLVLLAI